MFAFLIGNIHYNYHIPQAVSHNYSEYIGLNWNGL